MIRRPKILAVDDEAFNLDIMEHYLSRAGFDVLLAEDGVMALQKLEENLDVGAIVLDRMMPKLGGMEFLGLIKADARFKDLPVVMQTAAAAAEQVLQGIAAGVHHYLTKPYEPAVLVGIVKSALEDTKKRNRLKEEVRRQRRILGLMRQSTFRFRTLDDAKNIAYYVANCFPEPETAVFGIHELILNAIEHGNLGITYAEKTGLVLSGEWEAEIERRLGLPENHEKFGSLTFTATTEAIVVHIKDEGKGFDWRHYLEVSPDRVTNPHGRGIASCRELSFHRLEYLGSGAEVVCTVNLNSEKRAY